MLAFVVPLGSPSKQSRHRQSMEFTSMLQGRFYTIILLNRYLLLLISILINDVYVYMCILMIRNNKAIR
jgi:hypothetical protein